MEKPQSALPTGEHDERQQDSKSRAELPRHVACTVSNSTNELIELFAEHRVGNGGEVPVARLLERLERPVRNFMRRRARTLGCSGDFEQEATQQALVAIVIGLDGCRARNDGELVAWVLGVARNQIAELLRREGPWGARLDDERVNHCVGESYHTAACALDDVEPGLEVLLEVVGRISMRAQSESAVLLWMRLVGRSEWQEVGEELGISAGAAKLRFQRLQVSLRAMVREQLDLLPEPDRELAHAWLAGRLHEPSSD